MQLIRGLHNLPSGLPACALTIGNFDGVHRGHQALLTQLVAEAKRRCLVPTVMLFEPHPQEFFAGEAAPARLQTLVDKLAKLERCGVERVICLHFGAKLAAMNAECFIDDLLVRRLGVAYLVVGDDFRFGHKRLGDFAMLHAAAQRHEFTLSGTDSFRVLGERVSSTRIREALAAGELGLAEAMLGEAFAISGRVAHGDKRGRTIGFPTANIALKRRVIPVRGVYAVEIAGIDGERHQGVANIGLRPTVGGLKPRLEVFLFDFAGDLYGRRLTVMLRDKIRDERKFDSFDELKTQIQRDADAARALFRI